MTKYALLFSLLFLLPLFGCSGTTSQINWTDPQTVVPLTENISQVLTRQLLVNQSDTTRVAVHDVAVVVEQLLAGQLSISPELIDSLVDAAVSNVPNVPANVSPIVKSVLLVGLKSVEAKLNQEVVDITQKNALLVQVVQAAVCGIIEGSGP